MGRDRGWVSVSVQTYQSHRAHSSQRILQRDYTVDEAGATLNALARNSDEREAEPEQQSSSQPTTSIYIRDWKVWRFLPAPVCVSPTAVSAVLSQGRNAFVSHEVVAFCSSIFCQV